MRLGAAAGVAAAFKAPIGGVLFVIEEACTHWRAELTWRAFFTCAITSYTIRLLNSMCASGGDRCGFYEGGGLVLFPEASFGDFHAAQAVLQGLLAAVPLMLPVRRHVPLPTQRDAIRARASSTSSRQGPA